MGYRTGLGRWAVAVINYGGSLEALLGGWRRAQWRWGCSRRYMINLRNNVPSSASSPVTQSKETNTHIPYVVELLTSSEPCLIEPEPQTARRRALINAVRGRPGIKSRAVSACFVDVGGETPGTLPPRSPHPVVVEVPPFAGQSKPVWHAGQQNFRYPWLQGLGPELGVIWEVCVYAAVL